MNSENYQISFVLHRVFRDIAEVSGESPAATVSNRNKALIVSPSSILSWNTKILGSESFTRWLVGGEVIHLIHTLMAYLSELPLKKFYPIKSSQKGLLLCYDGCTWPTSICHKAMKSQLTLSVLDPVETHPPCIQPWFIHKDFIKFIFLICI